MYSYNSVPVYQTRTEDRETRPSLLTIIDFHSEMTSLTPDPLPSPPDRGWGGSDFTENVVKSALDWVQYTATHNLRAHDVEQDIEPFLKSSGPISLRGLEPPNRKAKLVSSGSSIGPKTPEGPGQGRDLDIWSPEPTNSLIGSRLCPGPSCVSGPIRAPETINLDLPLRSFGLPMPLP